MKKILALILTLSLALSAALLVGCSEQQSSADPTEAATEAVTEADNREEIEVSRATKLLLDPAVGTIDGFQINDVNGNWWLSIHECYEAEDAEKFKGYFDAAVEKEENTDMDKGEKKLGNYTYQYAIYTFSGNLQHFSNYYVAFEEPVPLTDGYELHAYYLSTWMDQRDDATVATIEDIISTIEARRAA